MKSRLFLSITTTLATVATAYGKHEKMPIPAQLMQAKTVFIDNRSGLAILETGATTNCESGVGFRLWIRLTRQM